MATVPATAQSASPTPARVFGQNFSPWNHVSARFRPELVEQSPRRNDLRDNKAPVTQVGALIYDWRTLQRSGSTERSLATAREIRFRQPTLWGLYGWQICLAATVMLLQMALIAALLYEHRRRRTAEETARNSMTELAHVNRLAAARELSSSIAHEISQPLTSILAHAQAGLLWLAGAKPQIEEARTTFQDIVDAGHHAAEVVHNIRTFVKKAAPQNTVLNVNELIREVLSLAAADLRKHDISVVTALADGLPAVVGDTMQLKQVFMNLVTNAAEAMATVTDRPRTLHLTSIWDHEGVQVRVEDSGPGIAPNDLERVFVPFHTTKAKGMGVGLSISRSIVEAHHGRLWASTGPRFGAVLHLELPAAGSHGLAERVTPCVTQPAATAAAPIEPIPAK